MASTAPEPALYETAYVTSHKGPCRAGAFSVDGQLIATGSVDASIKVRFLTFLLSQSLFSNKRRVSDFQILDVDRMLAKSSAEIDNSTDNQSHPVIRTLYDHAEEVTCLEFHPSSTMLVSGSRDCNIKMFDYGKASVKKAHKVITVSFHRWEKYVNMNKMSML